MRLAEQIEHLEHFLKSKSWKNSSHSRKWYKKLQHKTWRRWSKRNLEEESGNPQYNHYHKSEY